MKSKKRKVSKSEYDNVKAETTYKDLYGNIKLFVPSDCKAVSIHVETSKTYKNGVVLPLIDARSKREPDLSNCDCKKKKASENIKELKGKDIIFFI